ncbi:hypothetical protein [Limnohabitans sp. T6-20]|uniref:hypothetical protein n=1 Tax=Limnohabitans sp. T6-20 TaxID=1100725 RepID=UPI001304A8D1|nr:hypothetical protein [Limnohabitans sp. T6-20]
MDTLNSPSVTTAETVLLLPNVSVIKNLIVLPLGTPLTLPDKLMLPEEFSVAKKLMVVVGSVMNYINVEV